MMTNTLPSAATEPVRPVVYTTTPMTAHIIVALSVDLSVALTFARAADVIALNGHIVAQVDEC
eukprot:m.69261 g.69261  ORF g.69261 m.69261 type:complete len:63 (-) comp14111_c0_seq1:913-1101(-)